MRWLHKGEKIYHHDYVYHCIGKGFVLVQLDNDPCKGAFFRLMEES